MSFRDVAMISVFLMFFSLAFFVAHFSMNLMIDNVVNNTAVNSTQQAVDAIEGGKVVLDRLDNIFFTVFIGLIIALVITGWFVGGHPIFMGIYFIAVSIVVVLSAVMSNFWEIFSTNGTLTSSLVAFPITNHIMLFLPFYMAIVGFVGIIAMFAKPRSS